MPKPPILPLIDWRSVYDQARKYSPWLSLSQSVENRDKMEMLRQSLVLEPQTLGYLRGLKRLVYVVAIAEDWCGDVVRHVPVLQRLADTAPYLKVRYISRELRPDLFARYLTNGGEAIPKFIFLSDKWVECGNWGPMPAACRELIARGKACGDVPTARKKIHLLYDADSKYRVVVEELLHLIDIASSREP